MSEREPTTHEGGGVCSDDTVAICHVRVIPMAPGSPGRGSR